MKSIVPAIIPTSAEDIKDVLSDLTYVPEIQIDVVDGRFVPFTSWPYSPPGTPSEVSIETDKFTLEVDLMVEDQIKAAKDWIDAGADMLVFHIEGIDLQTLTDFVQTTSISIGVSARNDTPLENFLPYIAITDYVQLMGIAEIGKQGQPFDERVLERIKSIKEYFPNHMVSIDGSVNKNTITRLHEAGADRFISGSAILSAPDSEFAYNELKKLVN